LVTLDFSWRSSCFVSAALAFRQPWPQFYQRVLRRNFPIGHLAAQDREGDARILLASATATSLKSFFSILGGAR
jgi:hypothetical protein